MIKKMTHYKIELKSKSWYSAQFDTTLQYWTTWFIQ